MNIVSLIGRLVNDPKPYYNKDKGGELSHCVYTIAIDRGFKNGDRKTDYIPCTSFSGASFVLKFFKKGMRVGVTGTLHSSIRKTPHGDVIYPVEVTVLSHDFADGKQKMEEGVPEKQESDFMKIAEADSEAIDGMPFN